MWPEDPVFRAQVNIQLIWIHRIFGGRKDIVKIAMWEVTVFLMLVLYRLLGYKLLGR